MDIRSLCASAAQSRHELAASTAAQRSEAVTFIADALMHQQDAILNANSADLSAATQLSASLRDRLTLNPERVQLMAADLRRVAELPDPLGEVLEQRVLDNGLRLSRRRVPVGTLAVVYEARPNVTTDIAALALRSGNALVLRGGKETRLSNAALLGCVHAGMSKAGLPTTAVVALPGETRSEVDQLLTMHESIDLLIPRGGQALQDHCRRHAQMAVVFGGIGICHLYWAPSADADRSLAVIANAKVQRPTVCNALDTVLLHRDIAATVLPRLHQQLQPLGVTLVLDSAAGQLLDGATDVRLAQAGDFDREWLSLQLGIKVVDGVDEAVDHIRQHGTAHSDGILTNNAEEAAHFLNEVDSAAVYWNASTRFTDGSAFGLGAEVAISTQRLHARGPMALEALTTYKWVGEGDYLVRR
ncbi:MAG: glutamate-5-semialdehyde dehydrogenase [Xanthomonadales bacterium]|nr:glutamate-5-semialdehyde dehydrogenase [Xanthomonadales bacterium]